MMAKLSDNQNGWNEYSKLVLKELETLADSMSSLSMEMQEIKRELAEMRVREDNVKELKQWRGKIDDVCSPSQLKELIQEVESLTTFKIRALTAFMVVQAGMGLMMWMVTNS